MRCKTCNYSLEGLTEHRCPECCREFDPSDPNTFFTLQQSQDRAARPLEVLAYIVIIVAPLALLFLLLTGNP